MRTALPMVTEARRRPAAELFVPHDRPGGLSLDDGPGSEPVRAALGIVLEGLCAHATAGGASVVFSLQALPPDVRAPLMVALGEGEVSLTVTGSRALFIRETALTGLWRVEDDFLEIADVPGVVRAADEEATRAELVPGPPPAGAMNVMPVLAELRHRALAWRPGQINHVVSISLLPMNEVDLSHLDDQLGRGPVVAESAGYGMCQVTLTAHRHVWRVRYRNAMGGLLLDTVEVGDVPSALTAAAVDIADSAARLRRLLGV